MNQLPLTEILAPLDHIKTGRFQQRETFDSAAVGSLARTIQRDGLITPPTVMAVNGHYELVFGDRRRRAMVALTLETAGVEWTEALALVCQPDIDALPGRFPVLGHTTVKVHLTTEADPVKLRTLATIENLQRVDLSPLEKATSFQSLLDDGLALAEVIERTGEGRGTINRYLTILTLAEPVRAYFDTWQLPLDSLKHFAGLPDAIQIELAEKMAGRNRQAIKAVVKMVEKNLAQAPAEAGESPVAAVEPTAPAAPKSLRDQLADAKKLISLLTMQLTLDARLLEQCADAMKACDADTTVRVMAVRRAKQIRVTFRRAAKKIEKRTGPKTQKAHLQVERFIEKRQRHVDR